MKTEELNKAKKYIEHVIGTIKHDGCLGIIHTDWILFDLEKALAAIEGDECSSDTDELSVEKLQEQLNTAKKALAEIAEILNDKIHKCDYSCDNFCEFDGSLNMYSVENVQSAIDSSLAEIGGDK